MAHHASALKQMRQGQKHRERNRKNVSQLKTQVRKFREAAEAGNRDEAEALMREASQQLDKATSKGVIHSNQAANKKARMATRLNKVA